MGLVRFDFLLDRQLLSSTAGVLVACLAPLGIVTGPNVATGETRDSTPAIQVLTLTVSEARGHRPDELTAADVRVSENGRAQRIAYVRRNETLWDPPPTLEAGERSNRSAVPIPRATVVLVDLMSQSQEARGGLMRDLTRALAETKSGASVYIYLLDPDGKTLHPVRALFPENGLPAGTGNDWTRHARELIDATLRKVSWLVPGGITVDDRVESAYLALETLGRQLAAIPGPKRILWITRGIPTDVPPTYEFPSLDYSPRLKQMVSIMADARVAVSPVFYSERVSTWVQFKFTLQRIADVTGGRAYQNSEISTAIAMEADNPAVTYEMGYYPSTRDGKYRKLQVACSRPGVSISTSVGQYADPPESSSDRDRGALVAAMATPFDAPRIGIWAAAARRDDPPSVELRGRVNVSDLLLVPQDKLMRGYIDLLFVEQHADGRRVPVSTVPVSFSMNAQQHKKALKEGLRFNHRWTLQSPSVRELRIIVRDRATKAVGSLTIPL